MGEVMNDATIVEAAITAALTALKGEGEGEGGGEGLLMGNLGYFFVHPPWNQRRFIPMFFESGSAQL